MSESPRTWEYEHTSWSEDDPLCAQLKSRADAMRDELLGLVAKYKWQREIPLVGALDYNGAIARLDELWESHLREQCDA